MTEAQVQFLRILAATNDYADYLSETSWRMPDNSDLQITRAEVEELVRSDFVGNRSRFVSHSRDDWWQAKITDAGRSALEPLSV